MLVFYLVNLLCWYISTLTVRKFSSDLNMMDRLFLLLPYFLYAVVPPFFMFLLKDIKSKPL